MLRTRGVIIDNETIVCAIQSILERLRPRPGDKTCSWLPISHDMGLIGMLLSALCGMSRPEWAGGGEIVLMTPEMFVRRPSRWFEACSAFGSTITCSPTFGLDLIARRPPSSSLNLSNLEFA